MAKKYIAKMQVLNRGDGKTYEKGEVMSLDHLNDDEIEILLNMRAVEAAEGDAQVSTLESIKGITPKVAEALAAQNIRTYAELQAANPDALVAAIEGTNFKQVRKWQADAEKANAPAE